ncbi:unnamed protein product [Effrenium voratum]|uniref:Major facilitator superfamily (MFS) profile domain-containing protein n=1 Tax=Effrenium voratum TaxID=2562239 RepID=A0AA36III1_9DINO|nr:unnamed protein product [Effrenium voratum]CAJ1424532.1 unnamed protein product [Effrenium voratum]
MDGGRQEGARSALLLLTLLNMFRCADHSILIPLKSLLQEDLHLTDEQSAWPNTVSMVSMMIFSVAFALLLAEGKLNRRFILTLALVTWSAATCMCAAATGLRSLCLLRVFVGLGDAAFVTVVPSLMADFYPAADRPGVFALLTMGEYLGGALSFGLSGFIAERTGWRVAVLCLGIMSFLCANLQHNVREPKAGIHDLCSDQDSALLDRCFAVLRNQYVVPLLLLSSGMGFVFTGALEWYPTYLQRYGGQDVGLAGLACGAASLAGGLLGGVLGMKALSLLRRFVGSADLLLPGIFMVLSGSMWLVVLHSPLGVNAAALVAGGFAFVTCHAGSMVPVSALLSIVLPSRLLGLAFVAQELCQNLASSVAPPLVGGLSDHLGLRPAMHVLPAVQLATGLGFLLFFLCLDGTPCPPQVEARLASFFETEAESDPVKKPVEYASC